MAVCLGVVYYQGNCGSDYHNCCYFMAHCLWLQCVWHTMASELENFGIKVNAIVPGLTYLTDSRKYKYRDIRE